MKKIKSICLLLWLTCLSIGAFAQENRLYISDVTMSRGSETTLSVYMDNIVEVTAVEFTLEVPTGFSINPVSAVLAERTSDHQIIARALKNGKYKFVVMSSTNAPISGMAGVLFTMVLKANLSVTDNADYTLNMSSVVMSTKSGENVLQEANNASVVIKSLPNLHVVSVECSEPVAGNEMTVKWKVQNDGLGDTENVEWKDYVWLVVDMKNGTNSGTGWGTSLNVPNSKLLASTTNVSSLKSCESYEKVVNVSIDERYYGNWFIVVTSDMYGVSNIDFSQTDNSVPSPYEPATASYGYLKGYSPSRKIVLEEGEQNGWSDNFFYLPINIAVPPLPDLYVESVTAVVDNSLEENSPLSMAGLAGSTAFYSGKHVLITAIVTNKGGVKMDEKSFNCTVYLSHAEKHEDAALIRLNSKRVTKELEPNESFELQFSAQIPYNWYGDTWFHVCVDENDEVYELANIENNWWRSPQVNVLLTPGADFEVSNVVAPAKISAGIPFDFSYTVTNIGPGVPYVNSWTDRVYLSLSDVLDNTATCIGSYRRHGAFENTTQYKGDNYTATYTAQTSNVTTGDYYLHVVVDADNEAFEYEGEENNVAHSQKISYVAPDLTAELQSVSSEMISLGSTVAFTWKVRNLGQGDVQNATLVDAIYVSSTINGSNAILIGRATHTVSIPAGGEKVLRANIEISRLESLLGEKCIFVQTNSANSIVESDYTNNRSAGLQKTFNKSGVNLEVSSLTVVGQTTGGAQTTPGAWLPIRYVVKNTSDETIGRNVKHEVFLSNLQYVDVNAVLCTVSETPTSVEGLNGGDEIVVEQQVLIPDNLKGGRKYLIVVIDREKLLGETIVSDNAKCSPYIFINGNLPALIVTDVVIPDIVTTSVPTEITCTIENQGQWDGDACICALTLSNGSNLGMLELPALKKGEQTAIKKSIVLDDGVLGEQTLSAIPNYNNTVQTMNIGVSPTWTGNFVSQQSPLPDLQITDLSVEGSLVASESAIINAKVKNIGDDATHKDKWVESFYLSTDFTLNTATAIYLGCKQHIGKLEKDASYEVSARLNIPANIHGYYFLYVVTDGSNVHLEKSKENNQIRETVYLENRLDHPSDLSITKVLAPSRLVAGEPVNLSYTVVNSGNYVASGKLRDVIYLSKDNQWDENDVMVGVVSGDVSIEPGGSVIREASGRILNVVEGDYYFIVKTNSTHGIVESDYDNNSSMYSSPSTVSFSVLSMGGAVGVNTSGYYKMPVTSGASEGKTLGFYLNHDEELPAGLYVSYEQVPSTARYDYASTEILTEEQEVLVPNVQEGTYYILAQSNAAIGQNVNEFVLFGEPVTTESQMTLSVREVPFGATSLSVTEGGADGWLSTEIHGALLDSIMDFRLEKDTHTIPAEAITFNSQTSSVATFNLNDVNTGSYDVVSELPDGTRAVLANSFKVVPGHSVSLGTKMALPGSVRSGTAAPFSVAFANGGNTDITFKELLVTVEHGAIATSYEGLKAGNRELHITPDFPKDRRGYVSVPPGTHEVINIFLASVGFGSCTVSVYVVK